MSIVEEEDEFDDEDPGYDLDTTYPDQHCHGPACPAAPLGCSNPKYCPANQGQKLDQLSKPEEGFD